MQLTPLSIDQKRDLCSLSGITLNGARAAICGALQPFALVISLENNCLRAEYAWETVAHVVAEARGKFIAS